MRSRRVVVVSTGRDCGRWAARSLASIAQQTHPNVECVVVDDASTEPGTPELIADLADQHGFKFIGRDVHTGTLRNQWEAIRSMEPGPEDVIVWVDTDDRLAHPRALERVVRAYDNGALMTYGSYRPEPRSATCAPAQPYPQHVIRTNSYRSWVFNGGGIIWNHLRTVSGRLFNELSEDDMKGPDGAFYRTAPDAAIMYPCLELSGGRFEFIPDVLLLYNSSNPNSEWRVDPKQINADHHHQLKVRRPKQPLFRVA